MGSWPKGIDAITLFCEDLDAAKQFYQDVFGLALTFEDGTSAVFDFGNTLINLLTTTSARELIEPAVVAPPGRRIAASFVDPGGHIWEIAK